MQRRLIFFLALLLPLTACSPTGLVNALVSREGYRIAEDIPYGAGPRQSLDLYIPDGASGRVPTVIFFYGGGWDSGAKEDYLFAGEAFASRGYLTAIPDYRLYPEVRYPAFLEDSAQAVAKVLGDLGQEGIEPGPVYLVGHSAGAYNVAMLSLDPRWLERAGVARCGEIAASAGLAGPYDFLPLRSDKLKRIFGPEDTRPQTQPIAYANGAAPPMLLISGLDDTTVKPANSERLAAEIRAQGGRAELILYENIGHIALVGSLAGPLRDLAPTLDDVDAFLRAHPQVAGNCALSTD